MLIRNPKVEEWAEQTFGYRNMSDADYVKLALAADKFGAACMGDAELAEMTLADAQLNPAPSTIADAEKTQLDKVSAPANGITEWVESHYADRDGKVGKIDPFWEQRLGRNGRPFEPMILFDEAHIEATEESQRKFKELTQTDAYRKLVKNTVDLIHTDSREGSLADLLSSEGAQQTASYQTDGFAKLHKFSLNTAVLSPVVYDKKKLLDSIPVPVRTEECDIVDGGYAEELVKLRESDGLPVGTMKPDCDDAGDIRGNVMGVSIDVPLRSWSKAVTQVIPGHGMEYGPDENRWKVQSSLLAHHRQHNFMVDVSNYLKPPRDNKAHLVMFRGVWIVSPKKGRDVWDVTNRARYQQVANEVEVWIRNRSLR